MKIVVGLGNPGEQYQNTRHNIGWLALDNFLGDVSWHENKKFSALTYQAGEIIFVKPLTFMNNSGQTVQKILNYYKLLPRNWGFLKKKEADLRDTLLVIHDDLDINFGEWRLASESSSAGHRGVESIINHLKTKKFLRIRLGLKNEFLRQPIPADKFVLQKFDNSEKERLKDIFQQLNLKDNPFLK